MRKTGSGYEGCTPEFQPVSAALQPALAAGHSAILMILLFLNAVIFAFTDAGASWNLGMDADARLIIREHDDEDAELHVIGISLRKTLADSEGDRLILFALFEAHDDLSERMLHEVYARYKGPLGRWNVTAGRFGLPYGLLTDFTASRLLFDSISGQTIGMDVDSGVMVSGVIGDLDYGVSLTQGYGGHQTPENEWPDVITGRIGWTLGESGEYRFGLSGFSGRHRMTGHSHAMHHRIQRNVVAIDFTAQPGRWTSRLEIQTGDIMHRTMSAAFGMLDFALLPRWDVTVASRIIHYEQKTTGYGYAGAGYRAPWFTFRGGYTYEYGDRKDHVVSFQLYRMVAFRF